MHVTGFLPVRLGLVVELTAQLFGGLQFSNEWRSQGDHPMCQIKTYGEGQTYGN